MTTVKKRITAAAIAAAVIAGQATAFVSAAEARDHGWRNRGDRHRPYAGYGHGYRPYHGAPVRHRDRSGDAVGAAILGIGALIIGATIADAARKKRHYDYHD